MLDAVRGLGTLETTQLVVRDAEVLCRGNVLEHGGEADDGQVLDLEARGVALAIDEVVFQLAIVRVETEFGGVGEYGLLGGAAVLLGLLLLGCQSCGDGVAACYFQSAGIDFRTNGRVRTICKRNLSPAFRTCLSSGFLSLLSHNSVGLLALAVFFGE